jgi:cytochrome P450
MSASYSIKFSDPYPVYRKMLQETPVFQDKNGTWHLTRYDDVKMMLSDQRFSRRPSGNFGFISASKKQTALDNVISRWSLFNDPPEHTRLREMMSVMISPRFMKDLKSLIETIVDSLLASLLQQSSVNFIEAFAYPLPVNLVNQLLGSSLDYHTLRNWSLGFVNAMDRGSPDDFEAISPSVLAMQQYFEDLIRMRETNPGNDWISTLVAIRSTYHLSIDDIVSTCIFLLLAGHETVQLSLGLGLMLLLKNPEQQQLLQTNPDLVNSAVEEILRFESPLNKASRWTREKIIIDEIIIPENQLVVGLINAANHDPLKFPSPDEFNITRSNNRHLAFGYGIHNCLGALLARLELQTAFARLTPHLRRFTLIEDKIEWVANSSLRYLFNLPLTIRHL